jgi:hypothetical protein
MDSIERISRELIWIDVLNGMLEVLTIDDRFPGYPFKKQSDDLIFRTEKANNKLSKILKIKAEKLNVCTFVNERVYIFNGVENDAYCLRYGLTVFQKSKVENTLKKYMKLRKLTLHMLSNMQLFFLALDKTIINLNPNH